MSSTLLKSKRMVVPRLAAGCGAVANFDDCGSCGRLQEKSEEPRVVPGSGGAYSAPPVPGTARPVPPRHRLRWLDRAELRLVERPLGHTLRFDSTGRDWFGPCQAPAAPNTRRRSQARPCIAPAPASSIDFAHQLF